MVEYKFGEMDSAAEINELAENLFNEGDMESLAALAKENGIPEDDVRQYKNGTFMALCSELSAALGKIDVEEAELKPQELMQDWVEYLRALVFKREDMAAAVRRKGKTLRGMIAKILIYSFGHQTPVDPEILKEADVKASKVTFGVPGIATVKKLIREYYLGGNS